MWRYVARSANGTSHQQLDLPCQDYADCEVKDHYLFGAVADGAGSAKFAELGSRSVVKSALKF
jgi:serine/threonine protein phosphatase PrpC